MNCFSGLNKLDAVMLKVAADYNIDPGEVDMFK